MKRLNSEAAEIGGTQFVYSRHPLSILDDIEERLQVVGSEKFFSDPSEEGKKIRESVAEFLLAIVFKKSSGKDWWVMQPADTFPDFILTAYTSSPFSLSMERFELVEVPPRTKDFKEALAIVKKKIHKGYPGNYSLLVYLNHERSEDWLKLLNASLRDYGPFNSIWTVHWLFRGKDNPDRSVAHRLGRSNLLRLEAKFDDPDVHKRQDLSEIMETTTSDRKTIIGFKPSVRDELVKNMRRELIRRKKESI